MQGEGMQGEGMATNAWSIPGGLWWLRVRSCWAHIAKLRRSNPRRLRLAETLPLGERRFVAVLEFEQFRFLLGGTASALVLLARLDEGTQKDRASCEAQLGAAQVGKAGRL